ncbi:hypothetical protein BDL97_05G056900 [Sphagnum fallax]|nr:hypothetical protein BDL97_05G056900 [Sphagnum fallax]
MALEAESFRPLSEFFVHYVNDFRYRKEFFIQHVHVLVEVNYENLGRTADESFYTEKLENLARYPPKSGSVMSYKEVVQEPVRNAVSSYPSHHVMCSSFYQLRRGEPVGVFTRSIGSRTGFDLLRCFFSLLVGQSLIRFRKILLGRSPVDLRLGLQLQFYDLQSSERVKRRTDRKWMIAWTLARDAVASRQEEEPKKYIGVRYRPKRSHRKPWIAEVKTKGEKVWIHAYSTPKAAALASDVGAICSGSRHRREALNFEQIPRLLPEIPRNLCEVKEQIQRLRRNPLFCLIYEVPEEFFLMDIDENFQIQGKKELTELKLEIIKLIRSVRKKSAAPPLIETGEPPQDIPRLLESTNGMIKRNAKTPICIGDESWFHGIFFHQFLEDLPRIVKAKDPRKHCCSLVLQFIRWVETKLIAPQVSGSNLSQMEAEHPAADIAPRCSANIPRPDEQSQDTAQHDFQDLGSCSSLMNEPVTFQAATPDEGGMSMAIRPPTSNCLDQATTTTLSSPIPNIVETTILPSPISNVEIANEGCQIGALELLEDLQDDCVLGENSIDPLQVRVENEQWTLGSEGLGLDCQMTPSQSQSFPFTCFSPLSIPINYAPPQDNNNTSMVHFPYLHEQTQDEEFEVGVINFLDTLQDDYILGEVSANHVEMSIEKVQPTSISKGLDTQPISEGLDCETTPMLLASISQSQPFPFDCFSPLSIPIDDASPQDQVATSSSSIPTMLLVSSIQSFTSGEVANENIMNGALELAKDL